MKIIIKEKYRYMLGRGNNQTKSVDVIVCKLRQFFFRTKYFFLHLESLPLLSLGSEGEKKVP